MAYRLERGESVADAVRRLVREEAGGAAAGLRGALQSRDEAIHEARKSVKKVRALLRLVRSAVGPAAQAENRRLRTLGRKLSELRDAAAMLEAVDGLKDRLGQDANPAILEAVRSRLAARKQQIESRAGAAEVVKASAAAFSRLATRAERWPVKADGFDALKKGFEKTFRNGRQAMARAAEDPTAENYHEWRKRVKDHWYHVRLLSGVLGSDLESHESGLGELSEWLGDEHNFAVLHALIAAGPGLRGRHTDACLRILEQHQADLREKALKAGNRLYREKPRKFAQRVARLWSAAETRPHRVPRKPPLRSGRARRAAASA